MDPSVDDLAAALRPIRAPVATEAEALADALLAFGLGLGGALIVYAVLRLFLARRQGARARLRAALAASRGLGAGERLLAQARLAAQASDAEVRATLGAALYRPDARGRSGGDGPRARPRVRAAFVGRAVRRCGASPFRSR